MAKIKQKSISNEYFIGIDYVVNLGINFYAGVLILFISQENKIIMNRGKIIK